MWKPRLILPPGVGAEVLGTDVDGLTLRILSHKDAAAVMALVQASREHLTPHGDYTDLVDRDLAAHGAAPIQYPSPKTPLP